MKEALIEQDVLRDVLAGHRGHCGDYKNASGLGQSLQPFTWLSTSNFEEDPEKLDSELQMFKRTREAVWFEARELKNEQWRVVLSGKVRVLYAEVDAKLHQVRALLQWAPSGQSS